MRARTSLTVALLLAACGAEEPATTPEATSPVIAAPEPPRDRGPEAAERCLPVVAAECGGCEYGCGRGTLVDGDEHSVRSPRFDGPLPARVDRWCVEGECATAFFIQVVCSGLCAPARADPTCAFRRGRCVSGRDGAMVEAMYQVHLDREREQTGTLSLMSNGQYSYMGVPGAREAEARFYFVTHPRGSFSFVAHGAARRRWPSEQPNGATLGLLRFEPDADDFTSSDRTRSFEVRHDHGILYFHSIVSELETWRVQARRPDDPPGGR